MARNVIVNHNFSKQLESWKANCCSAFVVSPGDGKGLMVEMGNNYVVVTNRKEHWQGLEQDITGKISHGSTYTVSVSVSISDPNVSSAEVQATLRLEFRGSDTKYVFIGRTSVAKGKWSKFEGTFKLTNLPNRVVFYLEGPPPGVDLLIESAVITSNNITANSKTKGSINNPNLIVNHNFSKQLESWHANCCDAFVVSVPKDGKALMEETANNYAVVTNRKENWQGLEQDITGKISPGSTYTVSVSVSISDPNLSSAEVQATLRLEFWGSDTKYIFIGRTSAARGMWTKFEGTFKLSNLPNRVVFYLEGPPPGVVLLIESVCISSTNFTTNSAAFEAKKLHLSELSNESTTVPDDDDVFLEVVGGLYKQDDIYGLGSQSSTLPQQVFVSMIQDFVERALLQNEKKVGSRIGKAIESRMRPYESALLQLQNLLASLTITLQGQALNQSSNSRRC